MTFPNALRTMVGLKRKPEKRPNYRRPDYPFQHRCKGSNHIPKELFVARILPGFPFRAVGSKVWLLMLSSIDREIKVVGLDGIAMPSIILPSTEGARDRANTTGIIVAMGPGAMVAGDFVSPEHDHDLRIGDVGMIRPNCGDIIDVGDVEYRCLDTPEDILGVGRRDYGEETRTILLDMAEKAMVRYMGDADQVLGQFQPKHIPKVVNDLEERGKEAAEVLREMRGKSKRSQFLFSKDVSQENSMVRKE